MKYRRKVSMRVWSSYVNDAVLNEKIIKIGEIRSPFFASTFSYLVFSVAMSSTH